ncbi:pyridoxal phosphate-dependent decarboxylase family protein [Flavilitoribacter nigricans]|uniref:Pyridoxal-dependent decarboxylase n=1 Tax=Flavilitoribacter nigricans (strain ATCC 23147 / DSM 23189 / NBRC 102662 / NCIMB 1420 / SS-2) TaxID=1122177 RepID=A0A2D0N3I9_FLAN2|nr:pyridoxal-dependent decarboxylase [Flavilitoribacter nigricans]PHN02960.1 pyridoxal-dependent decarboxylase [Flavilitoribacter nigricans DSM 23189 = NBRC 102662]
MTELLNQAYAADTFRRQGHALIDQLADYLEAVRRPDYPAGAIDFHFPEDSLQQWTEDLRTAPNPDVADLFTRAMDQSVRLLHPQYVGHQISPPVPVSVLAGLLGDFLNNGMGVYEMGMAGSTTERLVALTVARQLGFPEEADGFITSGGTLANLTALLSARGRKASSNIWKSGSKGQLALMVSEEAHYCVDRAVRIMGWGDAGIIKVPVDDRYCMRTDLLEAYYQEATAAGIEVIAVVGSACTTATGSFDDLAGIGDFCRRHDLWFHVDGAHGAALAFSGKYAPVVRGIDKADSVAMDFHKMLLTPSITTALVFRNGADSYRTFSQEAQYLFNREEPEWFNMAKRTFECTKLMIGFKAYSIIRTYGTKLFDEYVTLVCDLGHTLADQVRKRNELTLAMEPFCNIICFRYAPAGVSEEQLNEINERIRQRMLEDGDFYLVQTRLKGKLYLRCTLTNPFTKAGDLEKLLDTVIAVGNGVQV